MSYRKNVHSYIFYSKITCSFKTDTCYPPPSGMYSAVPLVVVDKSVENLDVRAFGCLSREPPHSYRNFKLFIFSEYFQHSSCNQWCHVQVCLGSGPLSQKKKKKKRRLWVFFVIEMTIKLKWSPRVLALSKIHFQAEANTSLHVFSLQDK